MQIERILKVPRVGALLLQLAGCSIVLPHNTKSVFVHSRKTFWYLKICRRTMQGTGFTRGVPNERV